MVFTEKESGMKIVSVPYLIWCFSIAHTIHAGVGLGSGTETSMEKPSTDSAITMTTLQVMRLSLHSGSELTSIKI